MELLAIGAACLFIGYLIGRLQTQFKYDRVLLRRGLGRNNKTKNQGVV